MCSGDRPIGMGDGSCFGVLDPQELRGSARYSRGPSRSRRREPPLPPGPWKLEGDETVHTGVEYMTTAVLVRLEEQRAAGETMRVVVTSSDGTSIVYHR